MNQSTLNGDARDESTLDVDATPQSTLPPHWKMVPLKSVAEIVTGRTPPTKDLECWGGEIPFITPSELNGGIVHKTDRTITKRGLKHCKSLPQGTVLVSCIGYVGKVGMVKSPTAVTNQQINSVIPKPDAANGWYLLYAFLYREPQLKDSAAITTVPILNKSNFEAFQIPLPPLSEQRAIASTLKAVQDAKEARRRELELERERKAALMQHLFTYGTRGEPLKDTEIGKMPQNWQVVRLGEIAQVIAGQSPTGDTYNTNGEGPPLINGPAEFGLVSPMPVQWTTKPSKFCQPEDILFCVRGNTTGRMNVADQCYCIGRGVAAIRGGDKSVTKFLHYFLQLEHPRIYSIAVSGGSTFPNINSAQLNDWQMPFPSLEEQNEIATILRACDDKISALERESKYFDELFRAMLEELMSGRLSALPLAGAGEKPL